MDINLILNNLADKGNFRQIPQDTTLDNDILDFSTNDYLGLATNDSLRREFLRNAVDDKSMLMSSSASRLLSATQNKYIELEETLEIMYGGGRKALLFNSGYHANTGILPAIADKSTLIIADKLVHASIIDGIILSRCDFRRFQHNDIDQLEQIVKDNYDKYKTIIVVAESVYSMDGDRAPIESIIELKRKYNDLILYLDEAHAFGVEGPSGLGLAQSSSDTNSWDIIIGTFGKAAASMGAFAIVTEKMKSLLVNKSRSLIFSTAIPPIQAAWNKMIVEMLPELDAQRANLRCLSKRLAGILSTCNEIQHDASHIQPLIIGNAKRAVELSSKLLERGVKALAIRTPTVPVGTERLRFSVSASMTDNDLNKLDNVIKELI